MKTIKIIAALLLAAACNGQAPFRGQNVTASSGGACTPVSGYSHCRILTLDHTQAGSSDSTAFPALISATLGSSKIQNASCFDVVFTSDSGGTTLIPWEMESCTQSTGVLLAWVSIATLSHSVDTKVYVSYQNSGISTAQNTGGNAPTAVWNTNFKGVYHLGDGSTVSLSDSTSQANNGIYPSATVAGTAGQINGAANLTGGFDFIALPSGSSINSAFNGNFTLSFWVKQDSGNAQALIGPRGSMSARLFGAFWGGFVEESVAVIGGTNFTNGTWQLGTFTYDGTTLKQYINATNTNSIGYTFTGSFAGAYSIGDVTPNGQIALMDEFRVSNVARSADWVTAEYNNQKASSTFVTVGAEI